MEEKTLDLGKKKSSMSSRKRSRLIFYCTMIVLPSIQFAIFYFYVNFQSFALGFQEYSYSTGSYHLIGFENFLQIFRDFGTTRTLRSSVVNSLTLFGWTFVFGALVAVLFSYYIYKQNLASGLFKIFLYLPHILGGVVVVMMYKYFVEDAIPLIGQYFGKDIPGLLINPATTRTTIIFYTLYTGFGTQVLVYSSAMSGISDSIIESAELDGITPMKELIFIVLPSIWNTFVTFMVSSVVGIFTNQMSLYTFYGHQADPSLYTFGYYLYRGAQQGTYVDYPYLSAMGLLLTIIVTPLTLFTRWALRKFGPSRD